MQHFRRAKSEWLLSFHSGPPGPGFPKIEAGAIPHRRLALPSRWRLVYIPAGGPRASPTHRGWTFWRTVGEGLKVNRPKAERSHPGVCPSRGPASVRPLRKERTAFASAVGAARPSLPPSRGKDDSHYQGEMSRRDKRGRGARPKVVTDEGDFLACTSPGGSPKGLPYPNSEGVLEIRR